MMVTVYMFLHCLLDVPQVVLGSPDSTSERAQVLWSIVQNQKQHWKGPNTGKWRDIAQVWLNHSSGWPWGRNSGKFETASRTNESLNGEVPCYQSVEFAKKYSKEQDFDHCMSRQFCCERIVKTPQATMLFKSLCALSKYKSESRHCRQIK